MLCEVSPVLHRYDEPGLDVNVTLPPAQNVVGPLAVMLGVGSGFTVTAVAALVPLQPPATVVVTV
jgi:hypothetical protein